MTAEDRRDIVRIGLDDAAETGLEGLAVGQSSVGDLMRKGGGLEDARQREGFIALVAHARAS